MNTKYSFDDGKYEVIRDKETHETVFYRNDEYWETALIKRLPRYNLFHAMLNEIDRLREIEAMYNGLCD